MRFDHISFRLDTTNAASDSDSSTEEEYTGAVECECSDLRLSDGTAGDCSGKRVGRRFCFVKRSPCVAIGDEDGRVEASAPEAALNGLVHLSYLACENRGLK